MHKKKKCNISNCQHFKKKTTEVKGDFFPFYSYIFNVFSNIILFYDEKDIIYLPNCPHECRKDIVYSKG